MKKLKQIVLLQLIVIYTRYLIGGAFVFASLIKIKGERFTTENGINEPIDSAWHFFETMYQSGLYWKFIGICQLIAGFLLLTQRYSKLGAVVNFPIIFNIFIITISYYFALTYVVTGLILIASLLLIIWDWDSLRILINLPAQTINQNRLENDKLWQIIGLLLFAFTFTYRLIIDEYDILFWISICLSIGIIGMIIGLKRKNI